MHISFKRIICDNVIKYILQILLIGDDHVKLRFDEPNFGIECIAKFDEDMLTLKLGLEDYDNAMLFNLAQDVEKVRQWCSRNSIDCDSVYRANNHLKSLGVRGDYFEE